MALPFGLEDATRLLRDNPNLTELDVQITDVPLSVTLEFVEAFSSHQAKIRVLKIRVRWDKHIELLNKAFSKKAEDLEVLELGSDGHLVDMELWLDLIRNCTNVRELKLVVTYISDPHIASLIVDALSNITHCRKVSLRLGVIDSRRNWLVALNYMLELEYLSLEAMGVKTEILHSLDETWPRLKTLVLSQRPYNEIYDILYKAVELETFVIDAWYMDEPALFEFVEGLRKPPVKCPKLVTLSFKSATQIISDRGMEKLASFMLRRDLVGPRVKEVLVTEGFSVTNVLDTTIVSKVDTMHQALGVGSVGAASRHFLFGDGDTSLMRRVRAMLEGPIF
jgi:hypothetical protein